MCTSFIVHTFISFRINVIIFLLLSFTCTCKNLFKTTILIMVVQCGNTDTHIPFYKGLERRQLILGSLKTQFAASLPGVAWSNDP